MKQWAAELNPVIVNYVAINKRLVANFIVGKDFGT